MARKRKKMRVEDTDIKHRWFSGRIVAFHAIDPGSIPGRCRFYLIDQTATLHYLRENEDSSQDNKQCFSTNKTLCSIYGAQKNQ